jgi:hypothetical protein
MRSAFKFLATGVPRGASSTESVLRNCSRNISVSQAQAWNPGFSGGRDQEDLDV